MNWNHEMRKHLANEHPQKASKTPLICLPQPRVRGPEERLRHALR